MLLLFAVLVVGVFYGISITKEGIGRIHGPLDGEAASDESPAQRAGPDPVRADGWAEADDGDLRQTEEEGTEKKRMAQRSKPAPETAISRLAGKAGELAGLLADGLIRLLVWLGDAVLS